MDKRRFFIVLFTCLLILPCSKDANGAEWKLYWKGYGFLYFYDVESISFLPNNIIRVWTKQTPQTEEDRVKYIQDIKKIVQTMPDNWSSAQVLFDINCKNRTFKTLEASDYDTENNFINATTIKEPSISYISPDSMIEELSKKVCAKKDTKKKRR